MILMVILLENIKSNDLGCPARGPFTSPISAVAGLPNPAYGLGDFDKADAKAGSRADYKNNTWHHHENMKTMQEVPKSIHDEFTHRGGVSNIKKGGC